MPDLDYQPTSAARGAYVERDGAVTRVVVPMVGTYAPTPAWVWELDRLSLVVGPIVWLSVLIARTVLARPDPPRAVFEVDATAVRLTLCRRSTGKRLHLTWPREAILDVQAAGADEDGLWIDAAGYGRENYLTDLPRQTVAQAVALLNAARGRDRSATDSTPVL